jgi:hypothetical protein
LNRRFLAIGMVVLLLGSLYIVFTIGFLFFGWGAQYRYELFYFPSPVTSTLDSLTATGRMVSITLPIVAVSSLLLSALAIRIPSPQMISAERPRRAPLPGFPGMKQFPTGVFATSGDVDPEASTPLLERSLKSDFLCRLFPYEEQGVALGRVQVGSKPAIGPERMRLRRLWLVSDVINDNIS